MTAPGTAPATTLVVPTLGRPSLQVLLDALAEQQPPVTGPVVVVDDRPRGPDLHAVVSGLDVVVLRSWGRGPARARNLGWLRARTPWVSFLDDDVVPSPTWWRDLGSDLAEAAPDVAGVAGRVVVPLPRDRRPTDWERSTAGLQDATWITADLSYRRDALRRVGGFDERFRRAFREDSDLGLRIVRDGGRIVRGTRAVEHPVRPAGFWASVSQQRGNADDALMRALHGRGWQEEVQAPRGRRSRHVAVTAAAAGAVAAASLGRWRTGAVLGAAWVAGTAELATARIRPGPRSADEVLRMVVTSLAIPPAATAYAALGAVRHRRARPWTGVTELVLFDRDGTLVRDVPYNGDPALVEPMPAARQSLDRLRGCGVRLGMVTNQSGLATGRLTASQLEGVQQRVLDLLGPFDVVEICRHAPDAGCDCRKPRPGLVLAACRRLGVAPARCVVVGDIESDVQAARAAGARGVLVPTPATRPAEVRRARAVAPHLAGAVTGILEGRW
jgi:HAD superfamily hydrolase (TIGR01662 family)